MTVADLLISRIARDGVDTVFSVTGGGIMFLVDAIARSPDVALISTHHEEFAGVAADGYARSGKPYGVAIGTTGPGAAHLFTAVAAAWQDSSPVLFIVGQVKSADASTIQGLPLRQNGTFEFDTTRAFAPICKYVVVLRSAETASEEIETALRTAQEGRPGPVLIEMPLDVQGAAAPAQRRSPPTAIVARSTEADVAPARAALEAALGDAKRPLVLMGIGAVRAGVRNGLLKALEAAGVPYICTQFGREAGRRDSPLYIGSPGIKSNRSANLAMMNCDLLIAIGTSLHQQVIGWDAEQFADSPSRKFWFECDPDTLAARRALVDDAFQLSAQIAADGLIAALGYLGTNPAQWSEWRGICADWREKYLLHYPSHIEVSGRMCLYRAISTLDARADRFSAAVTDAGIVWYALSQHYFPAEGAHYVSSGSFGAMGMALPMAIGAAAATHKPVLAVTGDGSAMMCVSELATLKAQCLPVLYVINNNDGYVSIRSTHDRYFEGRKLGTDGSNGVFIPAYESLAATFELPYRRAHSQAELDDVLDELLLPGLSGPVVLEIFTYVDQAVEPLVASRRNAHGQFVSSSMADMDPPIDATHA
ncbi:thiamine pyrophosphate-binding protein [Mycolicibacterium tusciae]|uniref:thiamine pyrophosphate-binding protein n=1 Tax=Mycolicibacterium tusciae TaxID=75922 RepID=UPI000308E5F4|nr:thiamine pyrophosphate-binding protein [Mycolicibacterium tusciae]